MIDTHCHLLSSEYDNLKEILSDIEKTNIKCILNGCDMLSNIESLELSKKYDFVFSAVGFHPSEVDSVPDNYISFIEKNINNIVAIGEIGLDYYWTKDNKDKQKEVFLTSILN